MFELRLVQGSLLKKILESLKDLVNDANFDCSSSGFSLQTMDSSHVALVALLLRAEGFEHFRCDRNLTMGMNIGNMAKMLKCAGNDDIVTIKADDGTDAVTFMFENPSQDKISDFEMKLMDIDSEHLGIPEAEYEAIVNMSSAEYARLCKNLSAIGDTVVLAVTKEGVRFSTRGDIGTANIVCRQNTSIAKPEDATIIEMKQPVTQTFALRYLSTFAKATPLSNQVTINLSSDLPAVVEYKIGEVGYLRFYLAPKIEEDENAAAVESETKRNTETKIEVKKPVKTEVEPILVDESDTVEEFKPKLERQPKSEVELILVEVSQNGEECGPKVEDEPEKKSNGEVGSFMEIKTEECEVMDVE